MATEGERQKKGRSCKTISKHIYKKKKTKQTVEVFRVLQSDEKRHVAEGEANTATAWRRRERERKGRLERGRKGVVAPGN